MVNVSTKVNAVQPGTPPVIKAYELGVTYIGEPDVVLKNKPVLIELTIYKKNEKKMRLLDCTEPICSGSSNWSYLQTDRPVLAP